MVEDKSNELTEAEAEQYDRQIRLWGLDSQKRLRASRVLLIGVSGLGAEIAKNIILSGVKSVCLLDPAPLTVLDSYSQFLAPSDKVGANRAEVSLDRARALNPNVVITAETKPIEDQPDSFYNDFDVVVATGLKCKQLKQINKVCRSKNVKFLCGDVWGAFGYMFVDLINHEYTEEVTTYKAIKRGAEETDGKPTRETVITNVKKEETFVSIEAALSVDWTTPQMRKRFRKGDPSYFVMKILLQFCEKFDRNPDPAKRDEDISTLLQMRDKLVEELNIPEGFVNNELFENVFGQVAASSAIVGGVLGQEVVKTVSQYEPPHNNMFFFNPITCLGYVQKLGYCS